MLIFIYLIIFASVIFAGTESEEQQATLSGIVVEAESGEPLSFVNIRVEGTTLGTVSSLDGTYLLRLPPDNYTIIYSMVGYKTENRIIDLTEKNEVVNIKLFSAAIEFPDIVVTTTDPAVLIMEAALKRKAQQVNRLNTYTYLLYTKFYASLDTLTAGRSSGRGDTTIVSIFESYSKGYFKKTDNYFNEIIQRRQSVNVPPQANFVAFGTNLNIYDDYVSILNEEIATPFHPDAISYYDFKLEQWIKPDDFTSIAKVKVTPASSQRKLFEGYVYIDGYNSYPLSVELKPNRAVQLPFDADLIYKQEFDEFENFFVMPTGLNIFSTLSATILWVIDPRLDINIATVAYDYEFNKELDDRLFKRRRVEINRMADAFDSTYWFDNAVLPLSPEEEYAYDAIRRMRENPDSVLGATIIDKYFAPVTRTIAKLDKTPFTGFEDFFHYNRVQGVYLGGGYKGELTERLDASIKTGYGTADKKFYGEGNLKYFFDELEQYSFNFSLYHRLNRRDNPNLVTERGITFLSLLTKNDYGDYYYAGGGEFSLEAGFGQLRYLRKDIFIRPTNIKLFIRNEYNSPAYVNTDFSLFGWRNAFRNNPAANKGWMRSVGLELNYAFSPLRKISDFGFQVKGELSNPSLLKSDFDFKQVETTLLLRTATLPLWTLDIRLNGGYTWGEPPVQRFFSLESSASSIALAGAFRGMKVKEFYGDQYAAISLEHNFGEVIPGVFRIPNVASFGIEFIALGNIGWTKFSERTYQFTQTLLPTTENSKEKLYYEAGVGFNRLLLFFRFDISARLSQRNKPQVRFTISTATN